MAGEERPSTSGQQGERQRSDDRPFRRIAKQRIPGEHPRQQPVGSAKLAAQIPAKLGKIEGAPQFPQQPPEAVVSTGGQPSGDQREPQPARRHSRAGHAPPSHRPPRSISSALPTRSTRESHGSYGEQQRDEARVQRWCPDAALGGKGRHPSLMNGKHPAADVRPDQF